MHLSCPGPVSCVVHILSFLRVHCSLMAVRWQVFFPSWVPSGLTSSPSEVPAIADDYDIFNLLIWQEIFHFSLGRFKGKCLLCSELPLIKSAALFPLTFPCEWGESCFSTLQAKWRGLSERLWVPLRRGVWSSSPTDCLINYRNI